MKKLILMTILLSSINVFAAGVPETLKVSRLILESKLMNGDELQNIELISKNKEQVEKSFKLALVHVERIYEVSGNFCDARVQIETDYLTWQGKFIPGSTKIDGEVTDVSCVSQKPVTNQGSTVIIAPAAQRQGTTITAPAAQRQGTTIIAPAAQRQGTTIIAPAAQRQGTTIIAPAAQRQGTTITAPAAQRQGTTITAPAVKPTVIRAQAVRGTVIRARAAQQQGTEIHERAKQSHRIQVRARAK